MILDRTYNRGVKGSKPRASGDDPAAVGQIFGQLM